MPRPTKLYRADYTYLFLLKHDLRRLIKLLQAYCDAPTILIDGILIEQPEQVDALPGPLASEIIVVGRALHPPFVDPATGISPALQLRITREKARLFVRADAKKDFEELISRIHSMFTGSTNEGKIHVIGGAKGQIGGYILANSLFYGLFRFKYYAFLPLWVAISLGIIFSIGAILWIWNILMQNIAPSCVLSLDDEYARTLWSRRKLLEVLGVVINFAMLIGSIVLVHAFGVQLALS